MDVVYKRLNADITPEALAQLAERKIILENVQVKIKLKVVIQSLPLIYTVR